MKFPDITSGIKALALAFLITLPLAAWKAGEIVAWIIRNVEISLK